MLESWSSEGERLRLQRVGGVQTWSDSQCNNQRPRPAKEVRERRASAGVGLGAGLLQLSLSQQVVL